MAHRVKGVEKEKEMVEVLYYTLISPIPTLTATEPLPITASTRVSTPRHCVWFVDPWCNRACFTHAQGGAKEAEAYVQREADKLTWQSVKEQKQEEELQAILKAKKEQLGRVAEQLQMEM